MSTNMGPNKHDTKVKEVLALLNPTHYQDDMWEKAFALSNDDLDLLKKYGQELQFIAAYVYDHKE